MRVWRIGLGNLLTDGAATADSDDTESGKWHGDGHDVGCDGPDDGYVGGVGGDEFRRHGER